MLENLLETRDGGAGLGRSAVSTAVLAHGVVLFVLVAVSLLAAVSPGDEKLPFPPFTPPNSIPVMIGTDPGAGARRGSPAPRRAASPRAEPVPGRNPPTPARVEPTEPSKDSPPLVRSTEPPLAALPVEPEAGQQSAEDGDGQGGERDGKGTGDEGAGQGPGTPGVPWGVPGGQPPIVGEDPIFIPGVHVESPVLVRRVEPVYPPLAIHTRTGGTVILQGVIGTDGKVESLVVLKSHRLLDEAALRAVRQWLYVPARHQGRPVKVQLTIRVVFSID